jgi:hypothetical protein
MERTFDSSTPFTPLRDSTNLPKNTILSNSTHNVVVNVQKDIGIKDNSKNVLYSSNMPVSRVNYTCFKAEESYRYNDNFESAEVSSNHGLIFL